MIHNAAERLRRAGYKTAHDDKRYNRELFVRERLLEFPFEQYPNYCYPARMLLHEHMRWEHIEQVIRFCENLRQPKGSAAGERVRLLGFQVLIIACMFGPEDPETRLRIARTVVMTISRKNGKSSLVAMMYLAMMSLQCFNLKAQDIQVGASDREQAGILFDIVHKLILLDVDMGLNQIYHVIPSKKTIVNKRTFSKLHCLSSDAYRAHGANPCSVLLDEFGNVPDNKARDFYGVLGTAFGSQAEPLLMMFSTQASTDSHIFSEFVDRAAKANTGDVDDPGMIGFLFDLPKEDDGTGLALLDDGKTVDRFAERNWTRPNPALEGLSKGGFRSLADLRAKAKEAREMPSQENVFCNLHLNQRITAHSPFLSQQAWARCLVDPLDEEELVEAECVIAIDLSRTTDLSALIKVWRLTGGSYYADAEFFMPGSNLAARSREDKVPYDVWVHEGWINASTGRAVDHSQIARSILDTSDRYLLEGVGFDRYDFDLVRRECAAIGFEPYDEEFWVRIGQGFLGMTQCVDALEKLVVDGRLKIRDHPVLTWNASNTVTVMDDAGNRKFTKQRSYGRIDGIVALAMAAWMAVEGDLDNRAGEEQSVYETQDLLVI